MLFVAIHSHRFGHDVHPFRSDQRFNDLNDEDVIKALDIDFEHDRDPDPETLEIFQIDPEDKLPVV